MPGSRPPSPEGQPGVAPQGSADTSGLEASGGATSLKRTLDTEQHTDPPVKRPHVDTLGDAPERALKVLVSNKQAGMVIGKGGVNVTKVLETTGARIRVSGPNEFFPLTMDRVVLITGTTEQLIEGVTQMMLEIMPTPEGQVEEAQQRRQDLLIADRSSGLIIGRGGDIVRSMCEQTGAKIQLAQREKQPPGVDERTLSLLGSRVQIVQAVRLVIQKLAEENQLVYSNMTTTYPQVAVALAGASVAYSAAVAPPRNPTIDHAHAHAAAPGYPPPAAGYAYAPYPPATAAPYPPQYPGYPPSQPQPPHGQAPHGQAPHGQAPQGMPQVTAAYGYGEPAGLPGEHGGAAGYGAPPYSGGHILPTPHGWGPAGSVQPAVTYTLHCPDAAVSAILGRGGNTIKELIAVSGASIKISQKGDFAPGTQHRIVTIMGAEQSAGYAYSLVAAKIGLAPQSHGQ